DTYSIGETARVMVVTDKPGNWVLFTQEADELFGYSLYGLEGTVKLVEFTVADNYTPNIFLNVLSVENYQLKMHQIQLIVPPDEKFLNVKLVSDKEVYRPQEEGVFDIEVTDVNEQPVAGEISLGIVDASVYYIQQEYAKDIREFFYGTKRRHSVQTNASFYQKQYAKLVRGEKNELISEDVLRMHLAVGDKVTKEKIAKSEGLTSGVAFGAVGGMEFESTDMLDESGISVARSPQIMASMEEKGRVMSKRKEASFSSMVAGEFDDAEAQAQGPLKKPTLRQDFRSTVIWQPTIVTDANGRATVKVTFPDSLTTWRATARSITRATDVGNTTHETRTKKDVIVRLQAPRFFTERDEVTISANVHNYTDETQKIKVTIKAEGLELQDDDVVWVEVPSQGEERVDWKVEALTQGLAKITVAAQGTQDADAMVKSYPVIPHGIEKFIAQALAVKGSAGTESGKTFTLDLPRERVEESTSLKLALSPSLAATMLDALPYLAGYPYGCVEQTMSRFLPGVIVKDTMKKLGLSESEVDDYINQVLVPREDPKHPERTGGATLSQIDKMTKASLNRLYDFQHSDGGWGWWKEGNSDRFMSAYVVWGLSLAKDAGVNVKGDALNRAVRFLQTELVEEENDPDMLAWMLHALGAARSRSQFEDKQIARLWEMREELNPYTRALFALSQHYRGDTTRALILARNLANGIVEDKENGTV
ncbi:MAG: alpha-2-macroglobulin, partial [Candidatus Omnitrophica bacterium]|nr:alpha-2-macroglobulin [Candidatus Omnitrophota bacterium]